MVLETESVAQDVSSVTKRAAIEIALLTLITSRFMQIYKLLLTAVTYQRLYQLLIYNMYQLMVLLTELLSKYIFPVALRASTKITFFTVVLTSNVLAFIITIVTVYLIKVNFDLL